MASALVKWALEHVEKSYRFQKMIAPQKIQSIMSKKVTEYEPRGLPVIENPRVEKILKSSFNNKYGGIHVLVAPSGSGKTTYMRSYANRHIAEGGLVQYFASELQTRKQFFTSFGDENRANDLFDVIPKKSVIIIDQIEHLGSLNDDIKGLLKHLAFESRRISGVSVIVSTSSSVLAKEIIQLNGNDKIRLNGTVSDWRWTPDMIDKYLEAPVFKTKDIATLKELAYKASCPAFLYSCADLLSDGDIASNISLMSTKADKFDRMWSEFEETDFDK